MKKGLILTLSALMALSLTACSKNDGEAEPTPASYTAGTYSGKATGMHGDLVVDVTFSEDKIENVVVKSHGETYGIGYAVENSPVESYPAQIVETQSLNVDIKTGATISSYAVINAVADAVTQAGGDVDALKAVAIEKEAVESNYDADVVIAGAGAAGLAAGIEALRNGAENVIILEKQSITGGATARSGGKLLAAGTTWQEKQGYTDTPQEMLAYMQSMAGGETLNVEMLSAFCNDSVEVMTWLEDMGVMIHDVEAIHQSLTPWRVHNTTNAEGHAGGGMTDGFGGNITVPMTEEYLKLGGKILYNTPATEIIMDADGNAVGLKGECNGSEVSVNAKGVILATGGYASNREMMARYADGVTAKYATGVPAGNLGDGIVMGEKVNAQIYDAPAVQVVYLDFNSGTGINEEAGLILNSKGERVANEYSYMFHVGDAIFKSGGGYGWYIATANDPSPMVQYAMSLDATLKASSVEELAGLMEVDPATLQATVDRYNENCTNGVDADFGKPADFLYPVEGEMYYALKLQPSVTVTFGGLVTNGNAEVLDTNNNPIPNLYAAGEVAFTGLFGDEYPCCGMAIGGAVYFGRIAGRLAAN